VQLTVQDLADQILGQAEDVVVRRTTPCRLVHELRSTDARQVTAG
jgi:hypothetical protein